MIAKLCKLLSALLQSGLREIFIKIKAINRAISRFKQLWRHVDAALLSSGPMRIVIQPVGHACNKIITVLLLSDSVVVPELNEVQALSPYNWHIHSKKGNPMA